VASYLQARTNGGRWLLRIEDIDPPREVSGASDRIIEALEKYGFEWDGPIHYQSASHSEHVKALQTLVEQKLAYRCNCSRRDLKDAPRGPQGTIYPGTCRNGCEPGDAAIRLRTNDKESVFDDQLQGHISQRLQSESGDFVIRRRDGLIAYHLAVVVDDELEGISEVVRGIDLLDSTPRQIWLQSLLGYRTPKYMHIPVITHSNGDKLSKLTGAPEISLDAIEKTLVAALTALQQQPPPDLQEESIKNIWAWAEKHWQAGKLEGQRAILDSP